MWLNGQCIEGARGAAYKGSDVAGPLVEAEAGEFTEGRAHAAARGEEAARVVLARLGLS